MPLHVLIVEDEPDSADSLAMLLSYLGCKVFQTQSGIEAIELALQLHPDLMLLDLDLPDMSGYEVARHLRFEREYSGKIVALTCREREQDELDEAGIDDYLCKPIGLSQLSTTLGHLPPARVQADAARVPAVPLHLD